ncbi:hypothetical protein [Novosphingobium panipatense]|uniref:hypothetical protein n=1 Tax=Novosphingobium panipatense TaxID=428991 RepID=UPI0036139417
MTIERVGMDSPRPLPTPATMTQAMDWAGDFVTGLMRDWPEHSWRTSRGVCDPHALNTFPADKTANDASDLHRGRMAAHMVWQLAPEEALIVEMDAHPGFWIFGMGELSWARWISSIARSATRPPERASIATESCGWCSHMTTRAFTTGSIRRASAPVISPIAIC